MAGATGLGGVAGFGASSKLHTDKVLRLSVDLPLIIEVVETDAVIQTILPDLSEMIGGGLITLEKANVILYRPGTERRFRGSASSTRTPPPGPRPRARPRRPGPLALRATAAP